MKLFFQIQTMYRWQTNSHSQLCFSHQNRDCQNEANGPLSALKSLFPHSGAEEN